MTPRGRRVLVTGAAGGLGSSLVRAFEAAGDRVLATDVVSTSSTSEPSTTGGSMRLDVTSDEDWAAARDRVVADWGGLDLLVNNAGVAGGGRLDRCGLDEWEWLTQINLFGVVRGMRTFVPVFKLQRSGRIVNVASLAGLVHPAGMASYNAVKAAVVALSETAGHELAGFDVGCSVVCPSYFQTGLMDSMRGSDETVGRIVRHLVETSPFTADDIAAEVLAGIDGGDDLILPDPAARAAYALKGSDRPTYDAQLRRQAARLEAAGG